jgi:DNA-binding transcriptional LysR family regulator
VTQGHASNEDVADLVFPIGMAELSVAGLRVVRQVARRGSFSAAADDLGYTQSAVSRQVAAMEAAAGRALFERHARGVRLTDAGGVVVRRADAVLSELDGARQELDDLATPPPRRLRVGAFSTALAALVPRALAAFAGREARTRVVLHEGMSDRLLARVARGTLDLAVLTPPASAPAPAPVELIALLDDPLLVAVGRDHRLAGSASVPADELRDEPWVAGSAEARSPLLGAWTASRWEPRIAYVARDWNAKLGLVAAGLAATIVPGLALPALPDAVAVVRIDHPQAHRTTALATRADQAGDARLAEALHDAAAELAGEVRRRVRR